jgi:hypothetical protein
MKRFLSILSVVALVALALAGCRKDPIEFNQVGTINMQLVKGFSHKNKVHSKGIWEAFDATVTIIYESGEDIVYNCVFSDPTGSGIYSNDNNGDRIYIIRNMNFRIRIEGTVDGESVSGMIPEAENEWLIFTDDSEELNVPPVMLYAGKTRLGIMLKEVGGDYVHAFASLAEYEQPDSGVYEEVWGGFYYIEKRFADLNVSIEEWNFFPIENYGPEEEMGGSKGTFEGFVSDLAMETEYSIKAFASTRELELYSRTVNFTTGNHVDSIMTLVTTELNAGVDFVNLRARIHMKEGYDLSKVSGVGAIVYPAASAGDADSQRWFYGELDGEEFYVNMSDLEQNTEYKYNLFAYYYDGYSRTCKGVESSFATEGSREFVVNTGRSTVTGVNNVSAVLYGEIVSGNVEYSSEIGFYYGRSADNMTEFISAEILPGQNTFTATLSDSNFGVGSTIYYCAVVKVEYNGELNEYKGSNMNFTLQSAPEISCSSPSRKSTYSFDIPCSINSNGRTCSEYGFLYFLNDDPDGGDSLPSLEYNDGVSQIKSFTSSVSGSVTLTLNGLSAGNEYLYRMYAKYGDEVVYSETQQDYTFYIGEEGRYGGVVFYGGSDFTLEMITRFDQADPPTAVWGETGELVITTDVPSTGAMTSGLSNTEAIIARYGLVDTYAAPACRIENSGSYLPSAAEMEAIARLLQEGTSDMYLDGGTYWTSDEVDADNAKAVIIDVSGQTPTYTISSVSKQTEGQYVSVYRY